MTISKIREHYRKKCAEAVINRVKEDKLDGRVIRKEDDKEGVLRVDEMHGTVFFFPVKANGDISKYPSGLVEIWKDLTEQFMPKGGD